MKQNLEEYYVAYFDVLGYKQYFEDDENLQELFDGLIDLKNGIEYEKYFGHDINIDVEIKVFSDNFVLAVKVDKNNDKLQLRDFAIYLATIQITLLADYNLLLRGGLTKGELCINDDIVFGPALINAVQIENTTNYPRIAVDMNKFTAHEISKMINVLQVDYDKVHYINYFKALLESSIDNVKTNITKRIKKYGHYRYNVMDKEKIIKRESVLTKNLWILVKYNQACLMKKYDQCLIEYNVRANEKLLKMEIILKE